VSLIRVISCKPCVWDYCLDRELEREYEIVHSYCVFPIMSYNNFTMANESPNCLVLIPNGDGDIIVIFSSTSKSNTIVLESSQQLVTLYSKSISWDRKFAPCTFFKPNNYEHVLFEIKQFFCCILCH